MITAPSLVIHKALRCPILVFLIGAGLGAPMALAEAADDPAAAKRNVSFTLDEALQQLRLYPRDPFLQYVALQLARRANRADQVASEIANLRGNNEANQRTGRRDQVDLFSIFTGALAIQESLQLDTMRGGAQVRPVQTPVSRGNGGDGREDLAVALKAAELRRREIVDVATLTGPTIKSHPWEKMLGDKKPDVGPLSRDVPEDFFFAEFGSLTKMLDVLDSGELWSKHLFHQTTGEARSQQVSERLRRQLVVETNPLVRPFYDLVVEEVAITGSDLFFNEGSDLTLLFRLKQPAVFKARMDGFLQAAEKADAKVKRSTGKVSGVEYVHLESADRTVHVYSAYPEPNLHLRSNSLAALERVLAAVQGKEAEGRPVRRLGETSEFAYIRTLMPRGAKDEDGFLYLSDAFMRRMVGPELKLTERRRVLCYNHLRMIGHGSLMFRSEYGDLPDSMEALANSQCAPGVFGKDFLACPDGGTYALSADGVTGVCSHHGSTYDLVPCAEHPVAKVTGKEADEYNAFLAAYNQYWRTFFDPIGVRIKVSPEQYRLETIVLPLIDNTIYTTLAMALGGKPEPLDALPVPDRNIFTVNFRFNKEALAERAGAERRNFDWFGGLSGEALGRLGGERFVLQGIGNQFGLHIYDAPPTFDFNLPAFLGEALGSFNGRGMSNGDIVLPISFLIASLNAPVYVSIPVQDGAIVDQFLLGLDAHLAAQAREPSRSGWFEIRSDFYRMKTANVPVVRCASLGFGPVKFRIFWARIGSGLYIASKAFVLEDLAIAAAAPVSAPAAKGPMGHALFGIRARNWNQVLPDFRLGWAENNRRACLDNVGPLSSLSRLLPDQEKSLNVCRSADQLYGTHFFCPEGGHYERDGTGMACSVHGTALAPRQAAAPAQDQSLGKLLGGFAGLEATLTFLEDGLHAVVKIDRKSSEGMRRDP